MTDTPTPDPDKVVPFNHEHKAVDLLFGPAGGFAIWVHNDKLGAKAAVRKGPKDIVEAVMMFAQVMDTYDEAVKRMAEMFGQDADTMHAMIKTTRGVTGQHVSGYLTRIRPSDTPEGTKE